MVRPPAAPLGSRVTTGSGVTPGAGVTHGAAVRDALRKRAEIGLLDVRPEGLFAAGHPLFAASFPLGRLEADVLDRLPRRSVPLVVYGDSEQDAAAAVTRLGSLGYHDVSVLDGGLAGWAAGGGELFQDVNAPSKAFGELVEATAGTPAVAAGELRTLLSGGADVVVVDARRFEEYRTMSIPTATSVPGAELVLRAGTLAPDPATLVVVNCAGRTRSIAAAHGIAEDEAEASLAAGISIGRIVTAAEVADVVAFLASPRSVAINGDAIAAGGGAPGAIHY
jgi:rhodanese-related sulfurtransferase